MLQVIYDEYDREISYRIPRTRVRDALAIYLMENHVQLEDDGSSEIRNYNDMASAVIRKLSDRNVGWLEEEADDMTYEKYIVMTEPGIRLAEFLSELKKPEKEEFSGYIYTIYNTLQNEESERTAVFMRFYTRKSTGTSGKRAVDCVVWRQ